MITIDEVRRAIDAKSPDAWVAAETEIWRRRAAADDQVSGLFGLNVGEEDRRLKAAADTLFEELTAAAPPPAIDWRTAGKGQVSAVKDQGRCMSCVAFATCAVMESGETIAMGTGEPLSEGHLFHCGGGSCKAGWGFVQALEQAKLGVGRQADLPWNPAGGCVSIPPALRVSSYRAHSSTNARKRAIANAPVLAGMRVQEDFSAYVSGVYRHVAGALSGIHAVAIVGYDDAGGFWIAKNSWGPAFGEEGFFRIAYGECGMDTEYAFYSVEVEACT